MTHSRSAPWRLKNFFAGRGFPRLPAVAGIFAAVLFSGGLFPSWNSLAAADPQSTGLVQLSTGDVKDDLAAAKGEKKTLMIYFWQKGCPYCGKMEKHVFTDSRVRKKIKKEIYMLEMNIFGAREITDFKGKSTNEKKFAGSQGVIFTPTIIFYNSRGKRVFHTYGYWQKSHFLAALYYVRHKIYKKKKFEPFLNEWFRKRRK